MLNTVEPLSVDLYVSFRLCPGCVLTTIISNGFEWLSSELQCIRNALTKNFMYFSKIN